MDLTESFFFGLFSSYFSFFFHLLESVHVGVRRPHRVRDDEEGGAFEEDDFIRVAYGAELLELGLQRVAVRDEAVDHLGQWRWGGGGGGGGGRTGCEIWV